ncbi:mycofactocin precursor MftA [Streptomyces sp. NPDC058001]
MSDVSQVPAPAPVPVTPATHTDEQPVDQDLFEQDLLVEEVSIDGMCGVY